jgi:hypothetical protein
MDLTLSQIIGGVSLLVALFLLELACHRVAWQRGYQKGWKDAEEWIVKLETEVDQERVKIWKEGV